ncbi:MAG TPA: Rrf2 family transcriptional regulator [Lachnospiraceae bacterium]|nr:Rrf2 family transcriptional regulator [Lachnospiraceae bacterium]
MKISTKGRYAVILMLDLATYNTGEPVRLKDIAKRQQISEKYLEQIISLLNKAGFVKSIRGPQGGYMLKNPPEKYTVGMILRQTEGSLAPVSIDDETSFERQSVTTRIWTKMEGAINEIVDGITLKDLVDWQMEQVGQYVI